MRVYYEPVFARNGVKNKGVSQALILEPLFA